MDPTPKPEQPKQLGEFIELARAMHLVYGTEWVGAMVGFVERLLTRIEELEANQ